MSEFGADGEASNFAVNFGVPANLRHEVGSAQVHDGRTAAMAIVHRLGGARVNRHAEYGPLIHILDRGILLDGRVRGVLLRG